MKVLVTGATGFIGSHVADALVAGGHAVRVSVRATSDPRWIASLDAETVAADLRDDEGLGRLVDGVDAVVHGAGITRAKNRAAFIDVNAAATERLAAVAGRAGVRRFVLLSSLAARGPDQAQAEGDAPVSWYGFSKLEAERRLARIADAEGFSALALRIGGVYGPRDTDLLPLFQAASFGVLPLPSRRLQAQPVHVSDVSAAVAAALEAPAGFGPWPVSHPTQHDWPTLGRWVGDALGRRVWTVAVPRPVILSAGRMSDRIATWLGRAATFDLRRAEDLASFSYTTDITPTCQHLAWVPRVDAREGLATTAAWYRDQGWLR